MTGIEGLVFGMQVTICLVKTPHKIMCAKAAYVCEIYLCETRKGKTLLACLTHYFAQSNLLAFLVILIHQCYLSCVPWIGLSWQCLIS